MRGIGVVNAGWGDAAAGGAGCDGELLELLLAAHAELTSAAATYSTELRALLLCGDHLDRTLARSGLPDTTLLRLARRRPLREASLERATRTAEIQRLAVAVSECRTTIAANRDQLTAIVNELAPGLTAQHRIGPVKAAMTIVHSR